MDTDTNKPVDVATTASVAQQVAPATPVGNETARKSSKKTAIIIVSILLIILVPLVGIGVTAGVAATSLGKNNAFSKLSAFIPTEQVPLLSSLGKSDAELLRDAVVMNSQYDIPTKLGGVEQKYNVEVNFNGTSNSTKVEGKIKADSLIYRHKEINKSKVSFNVGGSIKSGIINIDLEDNGFNGEFLTPSNTDIYMKLGLSNSVLESILPSLKQEGIDISEAQVKEYLNKYYKFDADEFYDNNSGGSTVDYNEAQKAIDEFMRAIMPDLSELMRKNVADMSRYATITNEGRKKVGSHNAIVLDVKLDGSKVGPVVVEFMEQIPTVLEKHIPEIIKLCEKVSESKDECKESEIKKGLSEGISEEEKKEAEDSIKEIFESIEISTLKYYISPVDNTIVKIEAKIIPTQKGLKSMSENNVTISKLEINYALEEISRGKDIEISAPKDYQDFNDLIEEQMKNYQNLMQLPTTQPSELDRLLQDYDLDNSEYDFDYDFDLEEI